MSRYPTPSKPWFSPVDPSWGTLEIVRRAKDWDVSHFYPVSIKAKDVLPDMKEQKVKSTVASVYVAFQNYDYYFRPKKEREINGSST